MKPPPGWRLKTWTWFLFFRNFAAGLSFLVLVLQSVGDGHKFGRQERVHDGRKKIRVATTFYGCALAREASRPVMLSIAPSS